MFDVSRRGGGEQVRKVLCCKSPSGVSTAFEAPETGRNEPLASKRMRLWPLRVGAREHSDAATDCWPGHEWPSSLASMAEDG